MLFEPVDVDVDPDPDIKMQPFLTESKSNEQIKQELCDWSEKTDDIINSRSFKKFVGILENKE